VWHGQKDELRAWGAAPELVDLVVLTVPFLIREYLYTKIQFSTPGAL
jgi:hypothetical protein